MIAEDKKEKEFQYLQSELQRVKAEVYDFLYKLSQMSEAERVASGYGTDLLTAIQRTLDVNQARLLVFFKDYIKRVGL